MSKTVLFARRYPIPIFAVLGLLIGAIFSVLNQSVVGHRIWFLTLIIGGIPVVWDTVKGMIHRHFASDIVAMLAIIAAILTNEALPGVVIVIMQTGGKALEDYAFRRASSSLDELMARSPRIAYRKMRELNKNNNTNGDRNCIGDQGLEEIKVTDIRIGDLLVVRPGDLIPADGTIITGQAQIDESALTGEPLLKNKGISDQVFSGTINSGGNAFEIQASKLSEDSQYAKIVQLVRKAQEEKAPIQRLADRYALWFTPVTLAISGIGWLVTQNPQTILSVLVVATPCSLIFATPVAIMSGINRCAKIGIIIKTGAAIEQIGKSQAVVFDKTGTITYGSPFIEDIVVLTKDGKIRQKEDDDNNSINNNNNSNAIIASDNSNYSDDLLLKAAAIEQMSTHPAARVIVQKAKEKLGNSLLSTPRNFHEIAGAGVEGDINDEHIIVGSQSLFEDNDNDNDSKKYQLQQQQQQQKQQSELEYDKELLLNTIKKTSQRENDSIIKY